MPARPRRPVVAVALLLLGLAGVAGCSDDAEPPRPLATSFPERGERVWQEYDGRQSADERVELDEPVDSIAVTLDCSSDSGDLEVTVAGFGGTGLRCPHDDGPAAGFLSREGDTIDVLDITVRSTNDVRWSVAVDVDPELPE